MQKSSFYYTFRFVAYLLQVCVALAVILYVLSQFAPGVLASIPPGSEVGLFVVILFMPPLMTGGVFYRQEQRRATGGETFKLAVLFSVAALITYMAVVAGANQMLYGTPTGKGEVSELLADPAGVVIVLAVFFVVLLLLNWLMFWAAMKGEFRKAESRAAKAQR